MFDNLSESKAPGTKQLILKIAGLAAGAGVVVTALAEAARRTPKPCGLFPFVIVARCSWIPDFDGALIRGLIPLTSLNACHRIRFASRVIHSTT